MKEDSGLPWAEIARRIGTSPYTLWRWVEAGVRPHWRHQMALLALAEDLGLAHILTAWKLPDEAPSETPAEVSPPHSRSPPKNAARRQGGGHRQGLNAKRGAYRTAEGEGTVIRYSPSFI